MACLPIPPYLQNRFFFQTNFQTICLNIRLNYLFGTTGSVDGFSAGVVGTVGTSTGSEVVV